MSQTTLAKYEQARNALATCQRVDEAKDIRDQAEALRVYARQRDDQEMEIWVAEIKLRATRRIGEISRDLGKAKQGTAKNGKRGGTNELPPGGVSKNDALKSAGLSTQTASICERIASIPEKDFETVIAEKKAERKPITASDVEKIAARKAWPRKPRASGTTKKKSGDRAAYAWDLFNRLFAELSSEWVAEADKKMMRSLFRQFANTI
jgi:hypothetical protein